MRKETALHLSYDTRKLQALQYYLPQNGTSVEAAIIAHLDGIYDTQVPENVKEFLSIWGVKSRRQRPNSRSESRPGSQKSPGQNRNCSGGQA